jgi:hypothetical protein
VISNRQRIAGEQVFKRVGLTVQRHSNRSLTGNHITPRANSFKRISLNMTVPLPVVEAALNHMLASIERFEKTAKVTFSDLDIRCAPSRISPSFPSRNVRRNK